EDPLRRRRHVRRHLRSAVNPTRAALTTGDAPLARERSEPWSKEVSSNPRRTDSVITESTPSSRKGSRGPGARVLPGFRLTLGITLTYLTLLVLLPLGALALRALQLSPSEIVRLATTERALAAFRFSFGASAAAACADVIIGLLLAWVLAR